MLLSSSGASTSSIKQNGAGLSLNIANTSAIAVSAFSPPDNKAIVVFFLPGGCAKTCKPLSNISLPCSSSLAWPPANKVLKSALKCIFTVLKVWVNCSRVSPSIFNMASSKVCVAWRKSNIWLSKYFLRSASFASSCIAAKLTSPSTVMFCWI